MQKKVGIITINRNGHEDTVECIDSLMSNSFQSKEIIVVDNNSKNHEGSKLAKRYSNSGIHFILNEENRGFAGGCNDGIQTALELGCDYILLFNNDAVAKDGFIEELIRVAELDSSVGIIGPAITYYQSDTLWFAGGIIGEWSGVFRHQWKGKNKQILKGLDPYQTEYVTGCCMMIKKELIEIQGMLDEEYFAYYEEADYCFRARKKGWKCIITPSVIIEHKKSASTGNRGSDRLSKTQAYLIARNGILFGNKNITGVKYLSYVAGRVIFGGIYDQIYTGINIQYFKTVLKSIIIKQ